MVLSSMDPTVFTSTPVCDRIAGRTVRDLHSAIARSGKIVEKLVLPFAIRLHNSGKKAPRGMLKGMCRQMVKALEADPSIINVEVETIYSELSIKEAYDIRFVLAVGDEDEQFVEFFAAEVMLTREDATVTMTGTDFRIHKHALSRFMQRERRPLTAFFQAAAQPLACTALIGAATAFTDSENIALPMGNGLLLGKATYFRAEEHPVEAIRMVIGPKPKFDAFDRAPSMLSKVRCIIEIFTYVDEGAMTESRSSLHKILQNFWDTHQQSAKEMFGGLVFLEMVTRKSEIANVMDRFTQSYLAARELVSGSVWKHFTNTARK